MNLPKALALLTLFGGVCAAQKAQEAIPILETPSNLPRSGYVQPQQPTVSIIRNVIPKDAIKIAPKVYLWSDPLGVRWIYEETSLGVAKMELIPITLSLKNDHTVVFEQPSPFGLAHVEKDTADLSPVERRLYDEYMEKQQKKADKTDKTDKR
jgi:hypothetical protein